MGDEILNKTIKYSMNISIFLLLSSSYLFSSPLVLGNDTKGYDNIFEKISETRVGIKNKEIEKIKNPFIVIYKQSADGNKTKKKIVYVLDAIFDKKAMINGKWYKIYSKIGTYKLVKIKKSSILLRNTDRTKELFIRNKNESKIKFSSK